MTCREVGSIAALAEPHIISISGAEEDTNLSY